MRSKGVLHVDTEVLVPFFDIDTMHVVWTHTPQALPIDVLAWYQCDHLGTPQELTDHTGQIAWRAQYSAWGGSQRTTLQPWLTAWVIQCSDMRR